MNAAQIIDYYVANKINENADVRPEGKYSALVDWPSPVDGRPNRTSRSIRVLLGRAYVDDFNMLTEDQQDTEGELLAARVQAALVGFDPLVDDINPVEIFP